MAISYGKLALSLGGHEAISSSVKSLECSKILPRLRSVFEAGEHSRVAEILEETAKAKQRDEMWLEQVSISNITSLKGL